MTSEPLSPPSGWYPDPSGEPQWRIWNGAHWTELTRPFGEPPAAAAAVPTLDLVRALTWCARIGLPAWFLGLGALVSALWYGPSAPVPEPAWLRDLSLMVGVVGLAVGTATLAVTLRALEGRWSASAVFPGFNLIAVSSLVAQRLTMPVGRRLLTLVLAIGLFAWRLRAVPEFALLPGLAVLDTITAVELARRDALETLGRRRP